VPKVENLIHKESKIMPDSSQSYSEVFDISLALKSVGDDPEFLAEVVGLTHAAWPTLLSNIREAVSRRDLRAFAASARLATAAARNVSAKRAYECALQLCSLACKGDFQAARSGIALLEREVEMLCTCLATVEADVCLS
jgi:hypothetical protein